MNIQPFYQECESQLEHFAVYQGFTATIKQKYWSGLGLCRFCQQYFWKNRRLKAKSKILEK